MKIPENINVAILKERINEIKENKCEKCSFGRIKKDKAFISAKPAQCLKCSENYDSLFVLRG